MKQRVKGFTGESALLLARRIPMPEGHPYPSGTLEIRLEKLHFPDGLKVASRSAEEEGQNTLLHFRLKPSRIEVEYSLESRYDPDLGVDTVGGLDGVSEGGITEEKQQWLEQARRERSKLALTPNGQKLLIEYGKHNEIYEEAFHSEDFLAVWRKDGITEQMSRDTFQSLQDGTPVNDKSYQDGTVTYNAHAFVEQTNLATAVLLCDPDFDPFTAGPDYHSKYTEASAAALNFKKIVQTTGNSADQSVPMTSDDVYQKVEEYPVEHALRTSEAPEDLFEVTNYYVKRLQSDQVSDPDRYGLQEMFCRMLQKRVEKGCARGQTLYRGTGNGRIEDFHADIRITRDGSGRIEAIEAAGASLPEFELELADAEWPAAVRPHAVNALSNMEFMREYLHQAVQKEIGDWIAGIVAEDENFHLK